MYTSFAFIPARSGSKRLKDKNIINLGGHPLLAYTVNAAIKSGIFTKVIVVTDSKLYQDIAKHYGAESFGLRPKKISSYKSQDYLWLNWIDKVLTDLNINYDIFSILRPTSPFRSSKTIIKVVS
jgi:CMP-N-acetylneuraminic acid synthetase